LAGPGERNLIQVLATCDVEAMALHFLAWCPNDADPLSRLDPSPAAAPVEDYSPKAE
jgi:hypothetical protein